MWSRQNGNIKRPTPARYRDLLEVKFTLEQATKAQRRAVEV